MLRRSSIVVVWLLVFVLAMPLVALAAGGSSNGQEKGVSEQAKRREGSVEPVEARTREQSREREQVCGECADESAPQTRERSREEKLEGDYSEEAPGECDRDRSRERASEETESAESSDSTLPPGDAGLDSGDSTETAGPDEVEEQGGFVANVKMWLGGLIRTLGLG